MGLGGDECIENVRQVFLANARSGIRYPYLGDVALRISAGSYGQVVRSGLVLHSIDAIHDEVHYHLLHMDRVGSYWQRLGRKYGAQRNLPPDHLRRNNFDQLRNRVIQIERLQIGRFSLVQQAPQAKNDLAGALLVPDDVGKDVADLDEIGRTRLEQHLCRYCSE